MLPHDKHTCTFRIVYTLYVCNKRINTQLQSMWILNKPWWKEQNIGIPECGRERCGKIFDYASSKIFATSPFASKIFASPTLCVYPFLSLLYIHTALRWRLCSNSKVKLENSKKQKLAPQDLNFKQLPYVQVPGSVHGILTKLKFTKLLSVNGKLILAFISVSKENGKLWIEKVDPRLLFYCLQFSKMKIWRMAALDKIHWQHQNPATSVFCICVLCTD